jgi:hypothetical protein
MPWTEGNPSFVAGEALERYRRVKVHTDGTLLYADADDPGDGVTLYAVAAGDVAAIVPLAADRSVEIEATEAVGLGVDVYAAADGKVQLLPIAAGTYYKIGKALEAAGAAADAIENLPRQVGQAETVTE